MTYFLNHELCVRPKKKMCISRMTSRCPPCSTHIYLVVYYFIFRNRHKSSMCVCVVTTRKLTKLTFGNLTFHMLAFSPYLSSSFNLI